MRLHRFYTPIELGQQIIVTNALHINQWKNVFRYKVGAQVILFDGKGNEHVYEIESLEKNRAALSLLKKGTSLMQDKNITLALALIKKDNFELVLQKCTELGVTQFIPLITERSEKKSLNIERGEKIIIEAVEQAGWGRLPILREAVSLENFLKTNTDTLIAFDREGKKIGKTIQGNITYIIGPEGGFGELDTKLLQKAKVLWYTLGNSTLRAETAAIVAGAKLTQ